MNKCSKINAVRILLCSLFLLSMFELSYAQSNNQTNDQGRRKHLINVNFETEFPIQFYRSLIADNTNGFDINYLGQVRREKPLFLGGGFSYGHVQNRSVIFTEANGIEEIEFREQYGLNQVEIKGASRYYLPLGSYLIQFYVQGEVGLLGTYNIFSIQDIELSEFTEWSSEHGSIVFNYEIGGGINVPLNQYIFFNLYSSYMTSNSRSFYGIDKEIKDNQTFAKDYFIEKKSPAELWIFQFGITFAF